jgi:hypothetical protein
MNNSDLSRSFFYSDSSAMSPALRPAHSGPELVSSVPQRGLADELARTLLTDRVELTRNTISTNTGTSLTSSFTIGLSHR